MHPTTADEGARACPSCRMVASRVKGSAVTRPRGLPYGEHGLELRWHKRLWYCRELQRPRKSFTEQIPQIPAGARITLRLRSAAGRRIHFAAEAWTIGQHPMKEGDEYHSPSYSFHVPG
ncbi:transposase family protein [Streptomyces sp. NPDC059176]|uniref:transposase family protein n=1 Tax=Streptomyces sp. NPDC059176 TaxID=3346758 RepID=UPI0036C0D49F